MFELNPLQHTDAWWQHWLMFIVAGILGYIIGYRRGDVEALESQLAGLGSDLDDCLRTKVPVVATPVTAFVAPVVAAAVPVAATSVVLPDDLKVVEGIGPKIEGLFNAAGIFTFKQLAAADPVHLKEILVNAGSRFQMHNPTTWSAQSQMADEGKFDELKKWQDELNKGKTA